MVRPDELPEKKGTEGLKFNPSVPFFGAANYRTSRIEITGLHFWVYRW